MVAVVTLTIVNPDGSRAMHIAHEESIPMTSPDPVVNAGRALMRLHDLVPEAMDRIDAQAQTLGVTDAER